MNKENKNNEMVELTDETLEKVSGGSIFDTVTMGCSKCGFVNVIHLSANSYTCANCGEHHEVMG